MNTKMSNAASEKVVSINDIVKSAQRLRLRRFGMSVATYAVAILATFLITLLGIGDLSVTQWATLIGLCLFGISLFFVLFYTGVNLHFSEPSLTREQIIYSFFYAILVMYWLPEARPIILLFFLPPFSFGVLSLTLRQYLVVVACVLGLYAALLGLEYFQDRQGFMIQYQLFLFVLFSLLLTWFAFFGGFVSNIRLRLRTQKEELASLNEELEERTKELEQEVVERKQAEEQAKATNKELEAFSYSVSHDLRAPLRAIDGFSEILSDDYKDKLDDEAKRLINVIRKNTRDMNQLITYLLDFSRLGRQLLKSVEIDMKTLAGEVFDELKILNPKRNIELEIKDLPDAIGDRSLVRQVFLNLLSNAIKFTGPRKIAGIEIGFLQKNKQLFYCVKDNGVGFEMKYAGNIFGVFQRLHSSEEFEGTGVGLAIVQKIIYKHGGKVWAEGEVGKGATFYFTIPVVKK